jgi:hypothetical protein
MNQRLINTYSMLGAQECVDLCQNIIAPEDRQMAFGAFYEIWKRHIEAFCLEEERMLQRLRPMNN